MLFHYMSHALLVGEGFLAAEKFSRSEVVDAVVTTSSR